MGIMSLIGSVRCSIIGYIIHFGIYDSILLQLLHIDSIGLQQLNYLFISLRNDIRFWLFNLQCLPITIIVWNILIIRLLTIVIQTLLSADPASLVSALKSQEWNLLYLCSIQFPTNYKLLLMY